jgi:cytochrome c peroxidase
MTEIRSLRSGVLRLANRALFAGLCVAFIGCGAPPPTNEPEAVAETTSALEPTVNLSGFAESLHTSGSIDRTNPFFQTLGTNPRTCETCHSPTTAWGTNSISNTLQFLISGGTGPLFNLVDSGNSPNADISTFPARVATFGDTVLKRGLTRFNRTINPTAEFSLIAVSDPYGFSTTTTFSGFRRPTPTANESKASSILWTSSPPGNDSSAVNAQLRTILPGGVRLHEQGAVAATQAQADAAGDFMFGVIFAQTVDFKAGRLDSDGANGGPAALLAQPFYFGINGSPTDPVTGLPPNPNVFNIYDGWSKYAGLGNDGSPQAARGAIYRGQVVFNTAGHCSGCHNTPNVGGHSTPVFFNTGTAEPPKCGSDLPLLTLQNKTSGDTKLTCDPGRALSTGLWADIGKFRAPPLRGLASRAPYFHDGQAATINDVIQHYQDHFSLGLTTRQTSDLAAFLNAL